MAQVEILMYIALGFATAALIALLLGRLLWNLAVGVGRRRAQRTAATPAVAALQAERNQLRAEAAMLARRVEVRLDELRAQVAEHMAEVSRSRNRVDRLGAEIAKRDALLAERDSEAARLRERIAGLEAEHAARTSSVDELQGEHGKGGEANAALDRQLAERDREIERLRAEVERLAVARSEAVSRERSVQQRLKGRIEDLSDLSRQIEAQRRRLVARQSRSRMLRDESRPDEASPAEPPERQPVALQEELDRLEEIWAAKLDDVARAVSTEPPAAEAGSEAVAPEAMPAPADGNGAARLAGPKAAAEDNRKGPSGLANVISLAQRIRALQRNSP